MSAHVIDQGLAMAPVNVAYSDGLSALDRLAAAADECSYCVNLVSAETERDRLADELAVCRAALTGIAADRMVDRIRTEEK